MTQTYHIKNGNRTLKNHNVINLNEITLGYLCIWFKYKVSEIGYILFYSINSFPCLNIFLQAVPLSGDNDDLLLPVLGFC